MNFILSFSGVFLLKYKVEEDLVACVPAIKSKFCFIINFPNPAEGFYQWPRKKCTERFCSDSSSDCGSSSGSVRASRGSWGSWSSTSSSDGDKKPMIPGRHYLPSSKYCAYFRGNVFLEGRSVCLMFRGKAESK